MTEKKLITEAKQVSEDFLLPFTFAGRCATLSETITEVISITSVKQDEIDPSVNVTIEALAYAGQKCSCIIKGGTGGEKYLITATVRTSLGQVLVAQCFLYVRNDP